MNVKLRLVLVVIKAMLAVVSIICNDWISAGILVIVELVLDSADVWEQLKQNDEEKEV